jgi:SAM-dependent methyltransferase
LPKVEQLSDDTGKSLKVYQCKDCNHVQLTSHAVIYKEEITSISTNSPSMLLHRKKQVEQFVNDFNLRGRKILEVGCGDGHLLNILSQTGVDSFGLETASKAINIGRQQGLRIQSGYMETGFQAEGGPFDGFICLHVLEHVPDPNIFMQGVYDNCTTNAVGLIEVPSLEMILEAERFYDFFLDHLSYFSQQTLQFLLEKNGWHVLDIERNWQDREHLVAIVQKRPSNNLKSIELSLEELKKELTQFLQTASSKDQRVAIWGASCHSFTLLSQLSQMETQKLAYIVDSSSAKQGRFSPVSHLPIVSPMTLNEDPVDIIIICAPRYSDEIRHQLQNELKFKGTIMEVKGSRLEIIIDKT